MIGVIEQIGFAAFIFAIMLGMGATITLADFRQALTRPKAFLVGLISQFGFMPLIALGLALVFSLPAPIALSLIMVGATPGGTTSNLFTYYARGDVALSVSMTVASTAAALILMPLAITLYAGAYLTGDLQIPLNNIIATLVLVLVPVALGMWVRACNANTAKWIERIGSGLGALFILFLIFRALSEQSALFVSSPISILAAAILLGVIGYLFGYVFARLLKLSPRIARTISLETGIQNTPLTIAVIVLSFQGSEQLDDLLLLPAFYAFFVLVTSALVSFGYRQMAQD